MGSISKRIKGCWKIKITLTNIIKIKDPDDSILKYCKNELTFSNPDYIKKKRMGFWVGKTPKELKLYDVYNGDLYLPLGCFDDIWKLHPIKKDYADYSVSVPRDIKSNIQLREYQKPCSKALVKYVNGLFILPAGTGKTIIGLECAAELKQHTLWLTHTKELLEQAKQRCEDNLSCTTSVITSGKCNVRGDIVFATVQTLVNVIDKSEIKQNEFGLIIVDECHHLASNCESVMMFEKCVNYFSSRYKLGLTATLHRADGLEKTTTKILGNVLYELRKNDTKDKFIGYYEGKPILEVPASVFQLPAKIHFINTNYSVLDKDVYDLSDRIVFSKLITDIANDYERNKQILSLITSLNTPTIVISERVDQLHYLSGKTPNSVCIDGKTNKSVREQAMKDMRDGKYNVLFASYSLVAEGVDIPRLKNLVMATPVKDERLVIQSVGRCQRPDGKKEYAEVYDFVDDVSILDRFLRKRKKVYKEEGWEMR